MFIGNLGLKPRLSAKRWTALHRYISSVRYVHAKHGITDTRKDWHFKLAHHLCDGAGMIFVEDIDFRSWARGCYRKHSADAGFGQFVSILQWVCFKRNVIFAKVDKNYTWQQCPECGTHTGKKELDERIHSCSVCFYTASRDVAAAQVIRNRGIDLVSEPGHGLEVKKIACGGDAAGTGGNVSLASSRRDRKLKE